MTLGKLTPLAETANHVELSCHVSPRLDKGAAFDASSFSLYYVRVFDGIIYKVFQKTPPHP